MFGLYIHIPFCNKRCNYCSFASFATSDFDEPNKIFDEYISWLENEIENYAKLMPNQEINTLYFGWWTPHILGKERIINLIEKVFSNFNTENLVELSFECNPYPDTQVLDFVKSIQSKFKHLPRIRFSFGIQSLDDEVLRNSGRPYTFVWMVDFLRKLRSLKYDNTIFNFDFIAFGKLDNKSWKLWNAVKIKFFEDFVNSHMADSFSVYMLELSKESIWWKLDVKELLEKKTIWDDDWRYTEFEIIRDVLTKNGYGRYEISNFALRGKSSIHNRLYRDMQNYLWIWLSASSFLRSDFEFFWNVCKENDVDEKDIFGLRWTNSKDLVDYLWKWNKNFFEKNIIKESDFLIESFFLALRTDLWISDLSKYNEILIDNYQSLLDQFVDSWLVKYIEDKKGIVLTDEWMNVSNTLITDLLKSI